MVSLGQKFKVPKRYRKPFYRTLQLFRLKKKKEFARENTKFLRNDSMLKIGHHANAIAHAKAITFGECSVLGKNEKFQKHHTTRTLELFCTKHHSKKH